MRWLRSFRSPGRAVGVLGAVGLLLSLWLTWFYDRRVVPNVPLDAWENYARTDVLLALLALAGLCGSLVVSPRLSVALRVVSGAAACAIVVRAFAVLDPGRGARVALLAGLVLAASPVLDLVAPRLGRPADIRGRLAGGGLRAGELALPVLGALWRVLTWTPVLAALIAAISLPQVTLEPGGGTDGSWITALYVAAHRGMTFGTDVVYTYGPLGFLTLPRLYYADLAREAFLYVTLAYYGVAVTFLSAARRSFPLVPAALLTLVVLECFRLVSPDEQTQFAVLAMAFAWGVMLLRHGVPARARWVVLLLTGLALFVGLEALIKLNVGATIGLTLGIAAVAVARRRLVAAAVVAVAFLAGLVVVWLAAGQPLHALDDYARTSYQIIVGYPEYQYTEEGGREWEYMAVPIVVLVLGWTAWTSSWGLGGLRRAAVLLLTALVAFSAFKQGFTRHDGHSIAFFATTLAMAVALGWRRGSGAAPYLAVAVLFVAYLGASRPLPFVFNQPVQSVRIIHEHIDTLRDPDAFIAEKRQGLVRAEAVPEEALRLVRGHSFHAFPTEAALSWAYPGLDWAPLPIFQGFQAYTAQLDGRNAARLRSPRAPERLLRTSEYSPFEEPETAYEVACRYRELYAGKKWQVLARMPSRCGAPRRVAAVKTTTDAPVTVPRGRDDELLYMRVRGFGKQGLEGLRSLLYKPYDRVAAVDGQEARLGGRLLEQPHVLRIPPRYDFRAPYRMSLKSSREVVFRAGGEVVFRSERPFAHRTLTVEFYGVPLARPVRGRA